ncbi:hypothetical protein QE152_g38950 [Popillia japonica]|uniref:Uncharacterized protein n=1 Tax=Popillia japonica TaxID=7064 RepID=A0AAW1HV85_POPJA
MKVKALVSFSGARLGMTLGETREVPDDVAKEFIKIGHVEAVEEKKSTKAAMLDAAKNYAASYTGLTLDDLDEREEVSIAVLTLVSDMWDNRQTTLTGARSVNRLVDSILFMHSVNLLPGSDGG